jgi:riboflavin synthase
MPGGDTRFEFSTHYTLDDVPVGASICCSGVCLTVLETGDDWFAVTASAETLRCTTMGSWQVGSPVNFERALRLGDEFGGHIVSGHVDDVTTLETLESEGDSQQMVFSLPEALSPYVAAKGSVALDGVSLTVNDVNGHRFGVNIIPHTLAVTTLGALKPGDRVNVEIDMLARYVARHFEKG